MDSIVTAVMNQQDIAWVQCDRDIMDIGWSEFFDVMGNTVCVFENDFLTVLTQQSFCGMAA
jgi:hypothetical protein